MIPLLGAALIDWSDLATKATAEAGTAITAGVGILGILVAVAVAKRIFHTVAS